jgi:hypothetical protein
MFVALGIYKVFCLKIFIAQSMAAASVKKPIIKSSKNSRSNSKNSGHESSTITLLHGFNKMTLVVLKMLVTAPKTL